MVTKKLSSITGYGLGSLRKTPMVALPCRPRSQKRTIVFNLTTNQLTNQLYTKISKFFQNREFCFKKVKIFRKIKNFSGLESFVLLILFDKFSEFWSRILPSALKFKPCVGPYSLKSIKLFKRE